jgi:hypothetical protein
VFLFGIFLCIRSVTWACFENVKLLHIPNIEQLGRNRLSISLSMFNTGGNQSQHFWQKED